MATPTSDNSQTQSTEVHKPGPDPVEENYSSPSADGETPSRTPADYDPFDPENLRIDQSYLDQPAAKHLLVTVPVRRPSKQDFIRVHPAPDYRVCAALIELVEDRETYIIPPRFLTLFNDGEYYLAILYLTINRQKVLSFWPVKLATAGGRQNSWHTSAAEGATKAMAHWIRITANQNLGAYELWQAEKDFADPEWPTETLHELLKIAFKGRAIDGPEHPVLQKLRGRI